LDGSVVILGKNPKEFSHALDQALEMRKTIQSNEKIINLLAESSWEQACLPLRERLFEKNNGI
jgi:hypothetical protein